MKLNVCEIFLSIQGEGMHTGIPTTFIRLQGCNLLTHCVWCDTAYAQDGSKGTEMSVEEVLDQCVKLEGRTYKHWVCITGGEPLLQLEALHELVKGLQKYGFRAEVETNGSIKKPYWYTLVDSWVVDMKCPSSGVCGVSQEDWFNTRECDQIKFVVSSREDLDFARAMIRRNSFSNPVILVSPASGTLINKREGTIEEYWFKPWLQEVVEFCEELKIRFSLQVHKVVWGNKKGV